MAGTAADVDGGAPCPGVPDSADGGHRTGPDHVPGHSGTGGVLLQHIVSPDQTGWTDRVGVTGDRPGTRVLSDRRLGRADTLDCRRLHLLRLRQPEFPERMEDRWATGPDAGHDLHRGAQ